MPKIKTQRYRIVIRCGFYIVEKERPKWFVLHEWVPLVNEIGLSIFPSMIEAKAFLNKRTEGTAFLYGSKSESADNGDLYVEIPQ